MMTIVVPYFVCLCVYIYIGVYGGVEEERYEYS